LGQKKTEHWITRNALYILLEIKSTRQAHCKLCNFSLWQCLLEFLCHLNLINMYRVNDEYIEIISMW